LGWFIGFGIAAVVLMLFTLSKLRSSYVQKLSPTITADNFIAGLAIGGGVSIVSTLVLTFLSLAFFGTVIKFTGAKIDPTVAEVAGIDQSQFAVANTPWTGRIAAQGARQAARNPRSRIVLVVGIILLAIGAGYAFTALELGFAGDFAAMSAGVALPEELTKAAAGLAILYLLFQTKDMSPTQFRRSVLAAFGIAGLGFGAAEALKYFGAYATQDAGVFIYAVRAVWCVTLHGSWTLIVGAILCSSLPQDPQELEKKGTDVFYAVLLACIPMLLAHGLYNACCEHAGILLWIVGGLSMFAADCTIEACCDDTEAPQEAAS
ncbi:MAG TPA: PrsW family intramembrane metalloprotease, partial [Anaerolineae bacterium]|nr:PrsW family intramembrane metalloprotease [Anaerolineae bacterium]